MQLILLLALLLSSGNGDAFFKQVKPLLESVGGDDIKQALKSAEEFKGVFSAFGGIGGGPGGTPQRDNGGGCRQSYGQTDKNTHTYAADNPGNRGGEGEDGCDPPAPPFALAPVVRIADREIIYRLAQYFSAGAANA